MSISQWLASLVEQLLGIEFRPILPAGHFAWKQLLGNSTTATPRPIPFPQRPQYMPSMEGKPIERWRARKIKEALHTGFNYLARLLERMTRTGFTIDDLR